MKNFYYLKFKNFLYDTYDILNYINVFITCHFYLRFINSTGYIKNYL